LADIQAEAMIPPKLLLDTNIFRYLAAGKYRDLESRLLAVSVEAHPPVLWTCDIVHQELFAHLVPEEAHNFERIKSALVWIDMLCGNHGIAKGHPDPLRTALFVAPQNDSTAPLATLNRVRRQIMKASSLETLSENLVEGLAKIRAAHESMKDDWTRRREVMNDKVHGRIPIAEDRRSPADATRDPIRLVVDVMTEILRSMASGETAIHGALRPEREVQDGLREFLHYEAAIFLKMSNRHEYNFEKNRNDLLDQMLCTYPAVGYTIVTDDTQLHRTLELGKCPSPRILGLREGLGVAEDWLARQRAG
jgi:hypothetical protein